MEFSLQVLGFYTFPEVIQIFVIKICANLEKQESFLKL